MSKTDLKRGLGLLETTVIGVGITIGAGIYVLIGKAVGLTGPSVWISFVVAGILAALTGLSYAELSSMYPKDSSEYLYIKKAFKWESLAFLTGWICILTGAIGAAAVSLGFAGYFVYIFNTPMILTAMFVIVLLSVINFMGVKKSAMLDVIFTIAAVLGLVFIIFIGLKNFGSVNYFQTIDGLRGVFKSASLIFFAYIGFQGVVRLSEETREPSKTIPKAIILSVVITTFLYIGVAIASVSTLSTSELSGSSAPLADITARVLGGANPIVIAILAIFATLSTILAVLLITSRLLYGMAEEHSLPKSLKSINPLTQTPGNAILLTGVGSLFFILLGKIETVASIVNFMIFVIFILVNLSVISLRYKYPDMHRNFKVPINIGRFPILAFAAVLVSLFMLLHISMTVFLASLILIILGLVVYELITKEKTLEKGFIDPYRAASLALGICLFMLGSFIVVGGFLVEQFWWTGILWIILGAALFWYTYSLIFRE
ncbi:MAG: amino acid permease [Candidatus Woesearchaeota archaeon]|nr:MAG: amino acid permease [Candidatus Woesearchaeota archaeon]